MITCMPPAGIQGKLPRSRKSSAHTITRGWLSRIRGFFQGLIPLGYEDERGFHYGPEYSVAADSLHDAGLS